MKIKVKIQAKETENNEIEVQEIETRVVYDVETEEKKKQIDALLDLFEQEAASAPELIKDKEKYLNSAEVENLTDDGFDFNKKRRADLEEQAEHLEHVYEETAKKSKRPIPWRNYAMYFITVTTMFSCVTFSKYITEVSGGGSGTVASFDVNAYLVDDSNNKTYTFSESSNAFELDFKTANEPQTYYLLLENNSDVTVKVNFQFTGATGGHTFGISTDGTNTISSKTVSISAGKSQKVYLHFYGATTTVTDNAKLTITAEQVD